jgi:hypothetical protein
MDQIDTDGHALFLLQSMQSRFPTSHGNVIYTKANMEWSSRPSTRTSFDGLLRRAVEVSGSSCSKRFVYEQTV